MTVQNQDENTNTSQMDKELNFRKLEQNLKEKYEKEMLAKEQEYERKMQEAIEKTKLESAANLSQSDDDEDDEPYIDKRKLKKVLGNYDSQNKQQTKSEIQKAVQQAIYEERKSAWLDKNKDFYDVMQHAGKLPEYDSELADTILAMPDTFERQKLVYKNLKALKLHEDKKEESIQDKLNANRRTPYYQPSNVGASPYSSTHSDYSLDGQKKAYDKLLELKSRIKI